MKAEDKASERNNRDYIAIKAMQGMLSSNEQNETMKTIERWTEHISRIAYLYADAMLAESEKSNASK